MAVNLEHFVQSTIVLLTSIEESHLQMKLYKRKWVIIHLFLGHPSLSVHSWIEDEGGQKYSSESELHISATDEREY